MEKRKLNRFAEIMAFAAALVIAAALPRAEATLMLDFNAASNIQTQAGFNSATTAGGSFASSLGQGFVVDLAFASDAGIGDRLRAVMDAGQPLSQLGRDFLIAFTGQGATFLDVKLSNLKAGSYVFTGYIHDVNGVAPIDSTVSVNAGSGFSAPVTVTRSFGTNPAGGPATSTIAFAADGLNDVTFRVVSNSDGHIMNGLVIQSANPQPELNVDIGLDNHDVQPGFVSFERPFNAGSDDETQTFASVLGTAGTVEVTLVNAAVFRDRSTTGSPVSGPLGDLAESFFSHQDEITLILADLLPGEYEITTFHHDSVTDHNNIGVRLTDMTGSLQDLGLTIDPSNNTSGVGIETATFRFLADGINDIVIQFYEQPGSTQAIILNGFSLTTVAQAPVPEPGLLALLIFGGAAVMTRRNRPSCA